MPPTAQEFEERLDAILAAAQKAGKRQRLVIYTVKSEGIQGPTIECRCAVR